jgi:hypothetical protein
MNSSMRECLRAVVSSRLIGDCEPVYMNDAPLFTVNHLSERSDQQKNFAEYCITYTNEFFNMNVWNLVNFTSLKFMNLSFSASEYIVKTASSSSLNTPRYGMTGINSPSPRACKSARTDACTNDRSSGLCLRHGICMIAVVVGRDIVFSLRFSTWEWIINSYSKRRSKCFAKDGALHDV